MLPFVGHLYACPQCRPWDIASPRPALLEQGIAQMRRLDERVALMLLRLSQHQQKASWRDDQSSSHAKPAEVATAPQFTVSKKSSGGSTTHTLVGWRQKARKHVTSTWFSDDVEEIEVVERTLLEIL